MIAKKLGTAKIVSDAKTTASHAWIIAAVMNVVPDAYVPSAIKHGRAKLVNDAATIASDAEKMMMAATGHAAQIVIRCVAKKTVPNDGGARTA